MSATDPAKRWQTFTEEFFASPNVYRLAPPAGALLDTVERARRAWAADPATPFFLPSRENGRSFGYVFCPSREQAIWVRDVVRAYLGSWIDFQGVACSSTELTGPKGAAANLLGKSGCFYVFEIVDDSTVREQIRLGVQRLVKVLSETPQRRLELAQPLGRMIGDFWDACSVGAERQALKLLEVLASDHRLSRTNALFLRIQALAAFERWDELETLEEYPDLLRLDRPTLVSDALAKLAMARLPSHATVAEFDLYRSKFGALVPSVTRIRSAAGAQYYAYWEISSGEEPSIVAARLSEAGWLDHARQRESFAEVLAPVHATESKSAPIGDIAELPQILAEGRLDAAITLLESVAPSLSELPILIEIAREVLSPRAISLLESWRLGLGPRAFDEAWQFVASKSNLSARPPLKSLSEALTLVFGPSDDSIVSGAAEEYLRTHAVTGLMQPGGMEQLLRTLRSLPRSDDPFRAGELVMLLLDMERDLYMAAPVAPGIQQLRFAVVEIWALSADTGNRRLAGRMMDLAERLFAFGLTASEFSEIVELLRAAWAPFLTDVDVPLSLETLEMLVARQPEGSKALAAFAAPILTRIGAHNSARIGTAHVRTAVALAREFGLELSDSVVPVSDGLKAQESQLLLPDGVYVAIYSLMESAAERAASILRDLYPTMRVETLVALVANETLRAAARNADILVITDRAAAHAATLALVGSRSHATIDYARGKGSASILEAVEVGLRREFAEELVVDR